MEYESEPWVRRLRDGIVPSLWPFVLGSIGLFAVAIGVLVFVAAYVPVPSTGRGSGIVLMPLLGAVLCMVVPVAAWRDSRRDRRALANARAHGVERPSLHLPVTARGIAAPQDLPDPRTTLFTVDRTGLLGWSPRSAEPVATIPWERVERIDLATKDDRGRRVAYGLWLTTADGPVVLQPRSALGRPFEVGPPRLDVLRRVLRSLRP